MLLSVTTTNFSLFEFISLFLPVSFEEINKSFKVNRIFHASIEATKLLIIPLK